MKIQDIQKLAIKMGIESDFRGKMAYKNYWIQKEKI